MESEAAAQTARSEAAGATAHAAAAQVCPHPACTLRRSVTPEGQGGQEAIWFPEVAAADRVWFPGCGLVLGAGTDLQLGLRI